MYRYRLFDLNIASSVRMPSLPSGGRDADIVVRRDALEAPDDVEMRNPPFAWSAGGDVFLYWKDFISVRIRDGREIVVSPAEGVEDSLVVQAIQGAALGIALHQRGLFTLHASAVAVNGGVVAFAAGKGAGKSTIAAALHARGYPIVTDDVLAIEIGEGGLDVLPGVPHLKLYPDSFEASLRERAEDFPKISALGTKRVRTRTRGHQASALPPRCIYTLGDSTSHDPSVSIEPLSQSDACIELVRHSYALRFLHEAASGDHLSQCVDIVRHVPVRRIRRERRLPHLSDLVRIIEDDLISLPPRKAAVQ